jgi:hypothetical protein
MNWCPLYCRSIYYFLVLYNWGLCKWLELKPEHSKSLKVHQCCSTCYLHNPDCYIDEALGHLIQLKRQGLFYSQFSVKFRFFDLAGFCFFNKSRKVCLQKHRYYWYSSFTSMHLIISSDSTLLLLHKSSFPLWFIMLIETVITARLWVPYMTRLKIQKMEKDLLRKRNISLTVMGIT